MSTEFSGTVSSALSELLLTGRTSFQPENTRYVCHTSTIPLATTVDEQFILQNIEDTVSVSHSLKFQPGYDPASDYRCCKKHCMFVNQHGKTSPEILRENCPCGNIVYTEIVGDEDIDRYLQPLCFIQVLKEARYNFGYNDSSVCLTDEECCHNDYSSSRSNRPRLDLADVMYCQNSQSILDSKYSGPLRKVLGFDGWIAANTAERIGSALETLYWFRKFCSDSDRKMMSYASSEDFFGFKVCLEQTLHTVNGMICKKLLLFPCEMEGYIQLSKLTAQLFGEVLKDYLRPIGWKEPTVENSIFLRMKTVMKHVKRLFCSPNIELRSQCFEVISGTVKHCKFSKFWQHCLTRLQRRISSMDTDYTTSVAWIHTFGGFSQTRNLGYLPPWIAHVKRKEFRETIGREKEIVPKEHLLFIRKVVQLRQSEMGIEKRFLRMQGRDANRDFKEVINSIKLPLKPTASIRSTVFQGGKVEDARQLLNDGMDRRWKVPVRDLEDGSILEYIQFTPELRDKVPEHEGFVFWTSLQVVINWFGRQSKRFEKFIYEIPGSEVWEEELWKMSIVHISEPGKERNLTKTSAMISWVLTVASKVSQTVLAFNQDHRAGLILSAQDWMHQRRVSPESYESDWMYDKATRKRLPDVWNGFQDWKESTDHIPRQVGGIALQAWFEYIAFPRFYGDLVAVITQRDYKVSEYTHTEWNRGVTERQYYNGVVREGFMMSMPLTKTVLHLMHDINIGTVHHLLERVGVKIAKHPQVPAYDPEKDVVGQLSISKTDVSR